MGNISKNAKHYQSKGSRTAPDSVSLSLLFSLMSYHIMQEGHNNNPLSHTSLPSLISRFHFFIQIQPSLQLQPFNFPLFLHPWLPPDLSLPFQYDRLSRFSLFPIKTPLTPSFLLEFFWVLFCFLRFLPFLVSGFNLDF